MAQNILPSIPDHDNDLKNVLNYTMGVKYIMSVLNSVIIRDILEEFPDIVELRQKNLKMWG